MPKFISPKASYVVSSIIIGALLLFIFVMSKIEDKKLTECSIYTIAQINEVYVLRGKTRFAFQYSINSKKIEVDEGVNSYDTNESWNVDRNKLSKRRLLLQVHCNDINIHRILWDIPVPDSLMYIPSNGWKNLPFEKPN